MHELIRTVPQGQIGKWKCQNCGIIGSASVLMKQDCPEAYRAQGLASIIMEGPRLEGTTTIIGDAMIDSRRKVISSGLE